MYPYTNPSLVSQGLNFIKNIKWGTLLDGTSKTLGVINQAIPLVYQVKPLVNNAKTIFKISNILNGDSPSTSDDKPVQNEKKETISNSSPIFYL